MKVWLSYLIDCLAEYEPECSFSLGERSERRVSTVAPYYPELGALRADTLYLCLDSVPAPGLLVPETACFVTAPGDEAAHLPNRVLIKKAAAQGSLYNLLLDGVERYRDWVNELIHLSLGKSGPQAFLDASEHMLVNPILVQDPSYALLAISRDASTEDYPFFDFGGTLRPFPEFLLQARRDLNLVKLFVSTGVARVTSKV